MSEKKERGTRYECPTCGEFLVVFVKVSEPPMHKCGGSSQPKNWLPLEEVK